MKLLTEKKKALFLIAKATNVCIPMHEELSSSNHTIWMSWAFKWTRK